MLLSANFSFQVEDDEKPSSELLDHLQVEVGDNSSYNNFADHFRTVGHELKQRKIFKEAGVSIWMSLPIDYSSVGTILSPELLASFAAHSPWIEFSASIE